MDTAERLRLLFNKNGVSQQGVGRKIGIEQSYLSMYCRGARPLPPTVACKLAEYFDVNLCWLESGLGEMDVNPAPRVATIDKGFERETEVENFKCVLTPLIEEQENKLKSVAITLPQEKEQVIMEEKWKMPNNQPLAETKAQETDMNLLKIYIDDTVRTAIREELHAISKGNNLATEIAKLPAEKQAVIENLVRILGADK